MRFEVLNALRDLDQATPAYIRQEMFAHGDLKTRTDALEALRELDPEEQSSPQLRDMLKLV